MNNQTAMLVDGWKFEGIVMKYLDWECVMEGIAPWLTVFATPSKTSKEICYIWSKDEITDGLQINWK